MPTACWTAAAAALQGELVSQVLVHASSCHNASLNSTRVALHPTSCRTTRGAPLFLGVLRARPPSVYSALLAFRPDRPGPGAAAVIGSALSTAEPRFTLLVQVGGVRARTQAAAVLWLALQAFTQHAPFCSFHHPTRSPSLPH